VDYFGAWASALNPVRRVFEGQAFRGRADRENRVAHARVTAGMSISNTTTSYEEARMRRAHGLATRERLVELAVGGSFLLAALALALLGDSGRSFPVTDALIAVASLGAASMVVFEVGATYTMPVQLIFVPMLFMLPPEVVPLLVCLALMLPKLGAALLGRRPLGRAFMAAGDSWFALGPALVLTLAASGAPDGTKWPLYLLALLAQYGIDFAASSCREILNGDASLRDQLRESSWVYLVDSLLAPVGLAVAFAAYGRPWVVLLALPLTALMAVFARERRARMDYVLELGRAYRGTALVLGDVVEADDAYTGEHSAGVVDLAVEVAEELRLGPAARRNVEFGALLHDVGKIAVPKAIINKPGPLDDAEWEIMRRHTIEGQKLLDQIGGFMREVGTIVRASHERFDGGGYPDGLAGDAIPLEARVVCCCDAFSAMTTDRSYRKARPASEAIEELRACAGSQFDPAVVAALIAAVERREPSAPAPDEITLEPSAALLVP
jgi:putative nucleotidyltransferase with HDIG domain